MLIDLHCDTIAALFNKPECGTLKKNRLCVDIEKLKQANALAQFFALFVNQKKVENPLEYALLLLDKFYLEIAENKNVIAVAKNGQDLLDNQQQNKISAFLTIEEGGVIRGRIENLRNFYRLGVRLMTLTWNYPNEIGYPNHSYTYQADGLTLFGREVVTEMNCLGMIVDVSHLSDQGFYDVASLATKPFIASHSNSRSMTAHCRNLTDEMIRILAQKGGVMGVNFSRQFLGESEVSKVCDIVRHIRHIYQVGGIDVLALGTDFDGIDPYIEIAHVGQIDKLVAALGQAGFTDGQIEKICFSNSMRVIRDCL